MPESIIQMKEVNKWFGDFQVLKDINLDVKEKQKIYLLILSTKITVYVMAFKFIKTILNSLNCSCCIKSLISILFSFF